MVSIERVKNIIYWLFFLFLIFIVIEIIMSMFKKALGFEELVIGLLTANLGYSFHINSRLSEHLGWHKGKFNSPFK
ncbi:MAG: hypothetical protein QMD36_01385 [Candidatus Aenigmarchaeota archaeon]|nr:hypothetical protein [Candidatus Aenigmarchaeota archaeon]